MAREAGLGGFPADRAPGEVQKARRGGPFGFIAESVAELKKVEWPDQPRLVSGTAAVIIACLITGVFLYLNDQVWQYVVSHVLLK